MGETIPAVGRGLRTPPAVIYGLPSGGVRSPRPTARETVGTPALRGLGQLHLFQYILQRRDGAAGTGEAVERVLAGVRHIGQVACRQADD